MDDQEIHEIRKRVFETEKTVANLRVDMAIVKDHQEDMIKKVNEIHVVFVGAKGIKWFMSLLIIGLGILGVKATGLIDFLFSKGN